MILHLPDDGIQLLLSLFGSGTGAVVLIFFLVLCWLAANSKKTILARSPGGPPLGLASILTAAIIWIGLDLSFGSFSNPLLKKLFLLGRDVSVIVLGIWLPYSLNEKKTQLTTLLGRVTPFSKLVVLGLTAGAAIITLLLGTSWFVPFNFQIIPPGEFSLGRIGFFLLVILLIPATEELLFRWYLYFFVRARGGVVLSVLISSLVFALAHGLSTFSVMILGQAIVLALFVEYTRSILPGLILHSGYNFCLFLGGYWVS